MVGGRLVVRVLGRVEVVAGELTVSGSRPLERAFAARLAMARGVPVPDGVLARDLWGTADLARPAERLRVVASRLRRGLGDHVAALERTAAGFALDALPVDLVAVEDAMTALQGARNRGDDRGAQAATRTALDLWRGGSLSDLRHIPFGAAEGERLDALRLRLRLAWIEAELASGSDAATAELERLVVEHPLHERLVGLSALALHRAGRQAEALERLAWLRQALAEEVGVDPTPETTALEESLHNPGRARLPELHWPAMSSDFIGRDDELAGLVDRLSEPGLVTAVGGPGVGKTRLAREVAWATHRRGRPVAWLDLAKLVAPEGLHSALAAATGVDGGTDPLPRCIEALAGALLVIDNAEHLVGAVAELSAALRWKSNQISVLVTSRQPLRVAGEEEHQVRPLHPGDAARLFRTRTRTMNDGDSDPQVDAICAAVDRLPLGIELAAGLTRTLTVAQIADRIDRLRLSAGASHRSDSRHSSLRAALDWSHELLEPPARVALRRLAVFAGGCTLEAAEQVVAGDGLEAADVAALLNELSDRRLLTVEGRGEVRRFGMLETVRAYATEQLGAAGDEAAVRRRHVEWCAGLASKADQFGHPHRYRNQAELVRDLGVEEANLRSAIGWCQGTGRAIAIVAPLWWYWWYRGQINEARTWLRQSLATSPADDVRAAGLHALAGLTRVSGEYAEARTLGEQALTIFRRNRDDARITRTLLELSLTSLALQDLDLALARALEARELAEAAGDERCRGAALYRIGLVHRCRDEAADAERVSTEALACWRAIDYRHGVVVALGNLAIVARRAGEPDRARRLALDSLRMAREIGFIEGLLDAVETIGHLTAANGQAVAAARLLSVVDRQRQRLGAPLRIPDQFADREASWHSIQAATDAVPDAAVPLDDLVDELLRQERSECSASPGPGRPPGRADGGPRRP